MGTLLPADATRDKRSMLNAHVAALEGWYLPQSLDIWRQTPCKDLLGAARSRRSSIIEAEHTRSLVLPDSQFTYKKRPIRPKETTRRVRHTATPSPSVPRALAATALARPLPLATPSRSHNWQHPRPRVCAFDGRAFNSLEFTTRPVRASVSSVPSWKTIAHLVIHCNSPNTPAPRPPIKPG